MQRSSSVVNGPISELERGAQKANKNYYGYLVLLSFVSFGGHFARSSLSMFGLYFIRDHFISPAGLGMFLSACSLPSMFLPLFVGYLIDKTKQVKKLTMILLSMTIVGLIMFSFSVFIRSFGLAMLSLIVFGSGSSSIMAIQRMLITVYLKGNETFTTGFYIALANIAKLLGKITVAPTEAALDSYQLALCSPIIACTLSFLSYLLFTWSYDEASDCGVARVDPSCSCKEDNVPCRNATNAMKEVLSSIDIVHYHPSMASMPPFDEDLEDAMRIDMSTDDIDVHLSSKSPIKNRSTVVTLYNGSHLPSKQIIIESTQSRSYKVVKSGPSAPLSLKKNSDSLRSIESPNQLREEANGAAGGSITVPITLKPQSTQHVFRDEPSEKSSLLSVSSSSRYDGVQSSNEKSINKIKSRQQLVPAGDQRSRQFAFCCWRRAKNPMRKLPSMFFWYAAVHTMYIMIFHLLVNFIPHYAVLIWKQDVIDAGYIASIPSIMIIFLAPLVGKVVDRIGCSTIICSLAAMNTMIAYLLLLVIQKSPITIVVLLSISQALIPALTLAEISRICPTHSVGIAFGVVEVLDSCVNLFGNVSFGMLYNITGSYDAGMCGLMLLSIVGFIILLYLVIMELSQQRQQSEQQHGMETANGKPRSSVLPRYSFIARKEQSYTVI